MAAFIENIFHFIPCCELYKGRISCQNIPGSNIKYFQILQRILSNYNFSLLFQELLRIEFPVRREKDNISMK